jgi:hypothetical protein
LTAATLASTIHGNNNHTVKHSHGTAIRACFCGTTHCDLRDLAFLASGAWDASHPRSKCRRPAMGHSLNILAVSRSSTFLICSSAIFHHPFLLVHALPHESCDD